MCRQSAYAFHSAPAILLQRTVRLSSALRPCVFTIRACDPVKYSVKSAQKADVVRLITQPLYNIFLQKSHL